MRSIIAAAFILFFGSCLTADSGKERVELAGGRMSEIRWTIYETAFPIRFRTFLDALRGDETLRWCCGRSLGRGSVVRHFQDFTILGVESKEGEYQVEFEFADLSSNRDEDSVIAARVCFLSEHGRFYADDLRTILGPPKHREEAKDKRGEPGATDNPDGPQRLREDH